MQETRIPREWNRDRPSIHEVHDQNVIGRTDPRGLGSSQLKWILPEAPLSITTVPVVEGRERPYEDEIGPDGLLRYRYRGTDPMHRENVGLRRAMELQLPLVPSAQPLRPNPDFLEERYAIFRRAG